jgi:hypothetical protein
MNFVLSTFADHLSKVLVRSLVASQQRLPSINGRSGAPFSWR